MEDQIEGIETGADDYITKPFNLAFLSARIKNILLTRTKLKERYRKEISLQPTESVPVSHDEKLLKKVLQYVEERISDPELNIEAICSGVGLSRTHLYRKIKALTGLSMAEMVKEIRLKRAKQLLKDRKFNVNEVTIMVGFSDADYFRKCFKAEFGITPSEYSKLQQEAEKEG
jgi:AraC-like DNA-binding protein